MCSDRINLARISTLSRHVIPAPSFIERYRDIILVNKTYSVIVPLYCLSRNNFLYTRNGSWKKLFSQFQLLSDCFQTQSCKPYNKSAFAFYCMWNCACISRQPPWLWENTLLHVLFMCCCGHVLHEFNSNNVNKRFHFATTFIMWYSFVEKHQHGWTMYFVTSNSKAKIVAQRKCMQIWS